MCTSRRCAPRSPTSSPAARRGAGYGTFTAIYGLAWLAGSTFIGLLYQHSVTVVVIAAACVQALALLAFLTLLARGPRNQ